MSIEKIVDEIEKHVIDISLKLNHEFGSELENKLSSNQQLMLFLVGRKDIKHVKDLAYFMNVSASAISQMAAKLEQMDLIIREVDKNNRRNTVLTLGPEGKSLLNQMEENRSAITNKYLSQLTETDLLNIRDVLNKLNHIIGKTQKGETP
ncbi:MarR family winged helix-turn-helix transcriptional regulator [Salipaludibacillus aurantiacus]|uniref:DNA-binding transcriptional regulator, MarR family n=1 Tax=Salipaludibacillus aurantiacus TaxID=1601833 RepID=A0A1H9T7Z3_9BACI|nr:MarR family transcriptional regulator [Salipaludibacillus aurantiacus]SER93256.1 DNA-binding transcriptional regulator, MarR family [Salipaludibacillus aurantiacus]